MPIFMPCPSSMWACLIAPHPTEHSPLRIQPFHILWVSEDGHTISVFQTDKSRTTPRFSRRFGCVRRFRLEVRLLPEQVNDPLAICIRQAVRFNHQFANPDV